MAKLTKKQHEALSWLDVCCGWTDVWWGGRPGGGWPKQMPVQTYNALSLAKLIKTVHSQRFDRTVSITPAGYAALKQGE